MDLNFIFVQIVSGLTVATFLFLVASGLTLIFGVVDVFNFAHGSFYMLGAYLGYEIITYWHVNFWAALFLASIWVGLFGMAMEFFFLRRIYGRAEEGGFQILLTYSFILIIDDVVKMIWGTEYKTIERPVGLSGSIKIGSAILPSYYLVIIIIGLLLVILSWFTLTYTRPGKIARACAIDREMLGILGINVPCTMTIVFGIATALGGMSGILAAPLRTVTPGAGIEVIIDCLIVVVLGGMGNFWGAWIGALIIGEVNSFAVAYVPKWASLFNYFVMIIILIFKPEGLFGKKVRKKI